jgi:hypothetical protein
MGVGSTIIIVMRGVLYLGGGAEAEGVLGC